MKLTKLAIYAVLAIAVGHLFAAQISFTSGTPALAADVNANFTELYNAKWTRTGADLSYSAGNVGIGVATPLSVFHVSTGAPGAVFGTALANAIRIYPDTEPAFIWDVSTNLRFGTMTAINAGFSEKMRIQTNGNVGIGTASPGAKLHLQDGTGNVTAIVPNSSGTAVKAFVRMGDTGGNVLDIGGAGGSPPYPYWLQVHNENDQSSNGPLLLNPNGGNVGIGKSNPLYTLDLGGTYTIGNSNSSEAFILRAGTGSYIRFDTGGANARMTIDALGNVGIGTTGPGDTFSVANKVLISSSNSPANPAAGGAVLFMNVGNDLLAKDSAGENLNIGNFAASDRRLKKEIAPLNDTLGKINNISAIYFKWNRSVARVSDYPTKRQIGFVAQEIEEVFPELVSTDSLGYKRMEYSKMIPVVLSAIKELKTEKDQQILALNAALRQALKTETLLRESQSDLVRRLAQLEQTLSRVAHRVENPARAVARR